MTIKISSIDTFAIDAYFPTTGDIVAAGGACVTFRNKTGIRALSSACITFTSVVELRTAYVGNIAKFRNRVVMTYVGDVCEFSSMVINA